MRPKLALVHNLAAHRQGWRPDSTVVAHAWRPLSALRRCCLRSAGTPYANFKHVRKIHIAHHFDRADTVEFDYRAFINTRLPRACRAAILAAEWACVPAVELLMHARTALAPLADARKPLGWRLGTAVGTAATALGYVALARAGGAAAVGLYFVAFCLMLQFLAAHDAFQHTYTVLIPDEKYVPGPGPRTAQYEEENTYSDLLSTHYEWLNLLALNFGYHNAHHKKPMTPWYKLPALHASLYGTPEGTPQTLPFRQLLGTLHRNRLRRVLDEDYGVVAPPGTPDRAGRFVGSLGVSFLTV